MRSTVSRWAARRLRSGTGRAGRLFLSFALVSAAVGAIAGPAALGEIRSESVPYELSATALIMGGTGQPLSIPPDTATFLSSFIGATYTDFLAPTGLCKGGNPGCTLAAVYTPEELAPLLGDLPFSQSVAIGRQYLDNCLRGASCDATLSPFTTTSPTSFSDSSYVVVGESQSAIISSIEKSNLIAHPIAGTTVSFILLSNQNRPNGGLLERFVGAYIPILDIPFNGATPTNSPQPTPLTTVDDAGQYDGWADFPNNPLNLLADLNAVLGATFVHPRLRAFEGTPQLQGQFQDTTYYLQPTSILPLLAPLTLIPVIGTPLAKALDPPLRVLVETAYNRTINPGQPTPANFFYFPNPIKTLVNFVVAIPTGWDDAIGYVTGNPANRPFRTAPQPVYGVGGPPVYAGAVDPYGPPTPGPFTNPAAGASAVGQTPQGVSAPGVTAAVHSGASNGLPARVNPASARLKPARVAPAAARAKGVAVKGHRPNRTVHEPAASVR